MPWPFSRKVAIPYANQVSFRTEEQYIELAKWVAELNGLAFPVDGQDEVIPCVSSLEASSLMGLHGYLHAELAYFKESGIHKERQEMCKRLLKRLAIAFRRRRSVLLQSGTTAAAREAAKKHYDKGTLIDHLAGAAVLAEIIHRSAKKDGRAQAQGFIERPHPISSLRPHGQEIVEAAMVGIDGELIRAVAPLARPQFISAPPAMSPVFQNIDW